MGIVPCNDSAAIVPLGELAREYEPNLPWSMGLKRGKFRVSDKGGGLIAETSSPLHAAMIVQAANRYVTANDPTSQPSPEATDPVSADTIPS